MLVAAKNRFGTVDEYLASLSPATLEMVMQLRTAILSLVPDAREKISYQIPVVEWRGANLIYYAGWKKHLSLYPLPVIPAYLQDEISQYIAGRGTLKFSMEQPLPVALIQKVVKLRMSEILKKSEANTSG